jgi:hypothetical protein
LDQVLTPHMLGSRALRGSQRLITWRGIWRSHILISNHCHQVILLGQLSWMSLYRRRLGDTNFIAVMRENPQLIHALMTSGRYHRALIITLLWSRLRGMPWCFFYYRGRCRGGSSMQ